MRNARISLAGQAVPTRPVTEDMTTIRSVLAETGMQPGLCLEWLLDRMERGGLSDV